MASAHSGDSEPYELHAFSQPALYAALSNPRCSPTQVAGFTRVTYLAEYLESEDGINTKTLIVEQNYTDGDYLDDFAAYYVKCFSQYERKCKRLHFFDDVVSDRQFRRLVRGEATDAEMDAFQASYIGFVVARPLPEAIIGRTVLRTYDSDGGRRKYVCSCSCAANLFGIPLNVTSLAYQEQDTVLAACATVALWSSFQKTAELFQTPAPRPSAITHAANQFPGESRPIPSRGLVVQQIATAIRGVGLDPEIVEIRDEIPLVSLLRGYMEFGLPAILGVDIDDVGLHAMTLTGYSLKDKPAIGQESVDAAPMIGRRVNKFYAHDDQIGPFASVTVREEDASPRIHFEGRWIDQKTRKPRRMTPKVIIIPIYNKIRVTFLHIHKWVTRLSDVVTATLPGSQDFEWDVHLISTNEIKKELKDSSISVESLEQFRFAQHPRFIWRVLLRIDGQLAMELLADATDMDRSMPVYAVTWHASDILRAFIDLLKSDRDADKRIMVSLLTERFYDLLHQASGQPWYIGKSSS